MARVARAVAEAASRFSSLMDIDQFDEMADSTTWIINRAVWSWWIGGYERFRQAAAAHFVNAPTGDAAGRILKTCLLPPLKTLEESWLLARSWRS